MGLDILIGLAIVMLALYQRFNYAPTLSSAALSDDYPLSQQIKEWFTIKSHSRVLFYDPPPRSCTTVFKFLLYQFLYVSIGVFTYFAALKFESIGEQITSLVIWASTFSNLFDAKSIPGGAEQPIILAIIIVLILPSLPPFRGIDSTLRRVLYESAQIPAQQFREKNRLKRAVYEPNPTTLELVKQKLKADGFPLELIKYESDMSTMSLWTKACLLMEEIEEWQAENKYKKAFASIKGRESSSLSIDKLKEEFTEYKKSDALKWADALSSVGGEQVNRDIEDKFRGRSKKLLNDMYSILSRISLQSHYNESDRIKAFRKMGFKLPNRSDVLIPDHNDLMSLGVILALTLIFPLSERLGLGKAIVIGSAIFISVLIPLYICNRYPKFSLTKGKYAPSISFPIISGIIAGGVSVCMFIAEKIVHHLQVESLLNAVEIGVHDYFSLSYPWMFANIAIAVLIALRIRQGKYPREDELKGFYSYKRWGSLFDGAIFCSAILILLALVILPSVVELREIAGREFSPGALPYIVSAAYAFSIGFFVPTWYRAHRLRLKNDRRQNGDERKTFEASI